MRLPTCASTACLGLLTLLGAGAAPLAHASDISAAPVIAPTPATFAPMIHQVAPCVVTVFSSRTIATEEGGMDNRLRRFYGLQPGPTESRKQQGLGSGVVMRSDGIIITNNHVVESADTVKVSFADSREEYLAQVLGTDPKTDIAVLKIDPGKRRLSAVPFADSAKVNVGDLVFAIGNPFGVGQTVTMGIISAVGRGVGIEDYEDFLQTDASINPGNSGGALVDSLGRLVGINTAIISPTGSNNGIGFAVPAAMAQTVMNAILDHGKVARGYLGVHIQELNAQLAGKFSLPGDAGALVSEVEPHSPAEHAGLTAGDAILSVNGTKIDDARHLRLAIGSLPPGSAVTLIACRGGVMKTFTATLDSLLKGEPTGGRHDHNETAPVASHGDLGMTVDDLGDETRHELGLPSEIQGALITEITPGSHAEEAGLKRGMVIVEAEHKAVTSVQDLSAIVDQTKGDLLLGVYQDGGRNYTVLQRN